jgi:hypothetical protein
MFGGDELNGSEPTRGTRALIAVGLLLVAIPLSGVPRYLGGVSMVAGLCIALLLITSVVALAWPLLGWRVRGSGAVAFIAMTVAVSAFALALVAAPRFAGFPAGSCADAGSHLVFKNRFIGLETDVYEGMITLYALVHWLTQVGFDDLGAFRLVWFFGIVMCVAFAAAITGAQPQSTPGRQKVACVAVALATAAAAFFVALPLLQYYQSDGYLAQLFSLVPLVIALGSYAFASTRLVRVVALLASIALYRFTYLLNAGDLMLAGAILLLGEWRHAPKTRFVRVSLLALTVGSALASVAAYKGLQGIVRIPGAFREAPLLPQLIGLGLLSVVLGAVGPACKHFGAPLVPTQARLAHFLAMLSAAPTLLVSSWLLAGQPATYYVQKYAFCSIILGSLCAFPIVFPAVFRLVASGRRPPAVVAATALIAATGGGLYGLASSADTYTPWFRERYTEPPYSYLQPHADRSAWRLIAAKLREEKAEFGGFLTPRWVESHFTNAHFVGSSWDGGGASAATLNFWSMAKLTGIFEGQVLESKGHCVFWYEKRRLPQALRDRWTKGANSTVARLQTLRPRWCQPFTPDHAPSTRLAVCGACFDGKKHVRQLPLTGVLEGFHGIEKEANGSVVRWTEGNGKVPFMVSDREAGLVCDMAVGTIEPLPFELFVDGNRLGDGPRQPLPKLAPGSAHVLEIRSPVFVPSATGASADGRRLGVRVNQVSLECSDRPASTAVDEAESAGISVITATFGLGCGAATGNYTQSISDECNGRIDCSYPPADRRGDPFPGCAKGFSVEYRCAERGPVRRIDHPASTEHYSVQLSCD